MGNHAVRRCCEEKLSPRIAKLRKALISRTPFDFAAAVPWVLSVLGRSSAPVTCPITSDFTFHGTHPGIKNKIKKFAWNRIS